MPSLLRSEEHTSELQSLRHLVCRLCLDRKSTRLNSSHLGISYAVFCLKKKTTRTNSTHLGIAHAAVCRTKTQTTPRRRPWPFSDHPATDVISTVSLCDFFFFFFNDTATPEIYPLSLHDALPI